MKTLILVAFVFTCFTSSGQLPENWTSKQLIEPSALANELAERKNLPVIISVGPAATIPNSIATGMVNNKEGLDNLKKQLKNLPKEKRIIVYCGCCPFDHCPNVRPAIDALKEMKFTNYYLLDLPHNIKKDWIDKGYPAAK